MHERSEQMYTAASLYYVQHETMESIARQLGVSRSSVSRLLSDARESGLVRITLVDPAGSHSTLARDFSEAFGVHAHLVPVRGTPSDAERLTRVAQAAGQLVSDTVHSGMTIGVAWGTTLSAVAAHLQPRETDNTVVVQLNGGANKSTSGIPYVTSITGTFAQAFGSSVVHFPVPAFFDYAQTREAMWRERSVRSVLDLHARLDLAVFGVGSPTASMRSHVYAADYLDQFDLDELQRQHVVGDVCTVFLRENGSYADIALNARATGPTPAELQKLPRRICVAAGPAKARPLLAAMRARVATDVVVDNATARAVLHLARTGA